MSRSRVDVAGKETHPLLALVLAILSVPGSTVAWDLFDPAGFVIGLPLAIVAIVLGLQARRSGNGRGKATAAIVIGAAMIAMMVVWTVVEAL